MKNQYEIDYQQGYDKANDDWLERLDKIRAEIMQLDYDTDYVDYDDMVQTETIHTICREEVIQIIDEYKAESEDH